MLQRSSSCKLLYDKCLGFEDKIGDGFVFCRQFDISFLANFGQFSAEKYKTEQLQGCRFGKKETVKIDLQEDVKLNELLAQAMEKVSEGNSIVQKAQILAELTVDRLGGQAYENYDEDFYWSQTSSLQDQSWGVLDQCVGVLLGNLSVGQYIHRAILFKFLSDSLGILVSIMQEESGAKVYIQEGNCEYTVNLMDFPGNINKVVKSKADKEFEVLYSNSGINSTSNFYFKKLINQGSSPISNPSQQNRNRRQYIISTRCIDEYESQLHVIDPIYDFEQELDDDISLSELEWLIEEKVSQYRGCSMWNYEIYIDEFRMYGFSFGVNWHETLGDYIRVGDDNNEKLILEAYLVILEDFNYQCQRIPYLSGNFEDESLRQLVPRQQAPGFIASMKPGLVIVADCPDCNKKIIKPLKLFKNRTGTFNLQKGVSCPQCRQHLSELDSPCLAECDYNYQGEKSDGQIVDNFEWKTVYKNHVVFWKENENQTEEIPNWIKLKIFVKIFDTRYCVACQQQLQEDQFQEADCGHRYHPTCYRMVSKGQGYCVAEGCRFALTKKN